MKTKRLSIFITAILLLSGIFVGFGPGPTQNASGVGTLDSSVKAGDTYWYEVTQFDGVQNIIDSTGIVQNDPNITAIDFVGSFAGSQIYVKMIDKNQETMRYSDGSVYKSGDVPTVDITTGLILGDTVGFNVSLNNGDSYYYPFSAGMAFPMPTIFGTSTQFNVTDLPNMLLGAPFALNDDYQLHENVINTAIQGISGLGVTNDNSQFKIEATNYQVDSATQIDGFVSWSKDNGGIVDELDLAVTNTSTSTPSTLFDLNIKFDSKQNLGLGVSVGETYEITVSQADFGYSYSGDSPYASQELDNIHGNFTDWQGKQLVEFEVVAIDGLYVQIEGSFYNSSGGARIQFPDPTDSNSTDVWLNGFGRLGPQMPTPTYDPFNSYRQEYNFTSSSYYWEYIMPRERSISGIIMTQDYDIYGAWDTTIDYIEQNFNQLVKDLFVALESTDYVLDLKSSTSADPILEFNYDATVSSGIYNINWSLNWDIISRVNNSYYDSTAGEYRERFQYTKTDGDVGVEYKYDKGRLDQGAVKFDFTTNTTRYNSTNQIYTDRVDITNGIFEVQASYTLGASDAPSGGTSGDTTTLDDADTDALLDLPGFGAVITILGLAGASAIMVRRRR